MRLASLAGAAVLLCLSCADEDPAGKKQEEVETTEGDTLLFESEDYTVEPAQEKYVCFAHNLPDDVDAIVREVSGEYGPGTHHIFFAWTLVPEPEGVTECPVLFKTTWIPIYLGGVNPPPLKMPEGAAVDLGRGKQLVLQLHLQNTTDEPITNKVKMKMKLGKPDVSYVPAGIFGLDNRDINLPAVTDDAKSKMTCKSPRDMNVFATLGHMHKMGKHLSVSKNDAVVFEQVWNFDDQPITPLDLTVAKDDVLGLECTHHNTLSKDVTYGESSDNEMCATVFYYTPYDNLDGCVNVPL